MTIAPCSVSTSLPSTITEAFGAKVTLASVPAAPAWIAPPAEVARVPPVIVAPAIWTEPPSAAMVPMLVMVPRRSSTPLVASIRPLLTTALVPVLPIIVPKAASIVPAASLISVNERSPVPSAPEPLIVLFRLSSVSPAAVPVTTWVLAVPESVLSVSAIVPPPVSATVPLARSVAGGLTVPCPITLITSRLVMVPRSVSVLPL